MKRRTIFAQIPVGMKRLRAAMLAALAATAAPVAAQEAQTAESRNGQQNDANNPLTPKAALQMQDYVQPILSGQPWAGANQFYLRGVMPHDTFGLPQLARASMPVVANAWGPHGAWNGIGDLTIFDMAVHKFGERKIGAGPLVVAPTASDRSLGAGKWQLGVQTVMSMPHSWGLTSLLSAYQQSTDGYLQTLTLQPLVFVNLADGYYLRSTGIATFNLGFNSVVPVGLGIGRAIERPNGRVINVFVEPQYSVLQTGAGVPSFQVFTDVNLQFPLR